MTLTCCFFFSALSRSGQKCSARIVFQDSCRVACCNFHQCLRYHSRSILRRHRISGGSAVCSKLVTFSRTAFLPRLVIGAKHVLTTPRLFNMVQLPECDVLQLQGGCRCKLKKMMPLQFVFWGVHCSIQKLALSGLHPRYQQGIQTCTDRTLSGE